MGGTRACCWRTILMHALNLAGAILLTITTLVVSVYLVSTFTLAKLAGGSPVRAPAAACSLRPRGACGLSSGARALEKARGATAAPAAKKG
jgi:hypothetical protein